MSDVIIKLLYALFPIYFGAFLACSFAGVPYTRKNILHLSTILVLVTFLRTFSVFLFDKRTATCAYPFLVNLPIFLFLVFHCHCPWLPSAVSIFTGFLYYQFPYWVSYFFALFIKCGAVLRILIFSISCPLFLYFALKFIAVPIRHIIHNSQKTCFAFGLAPFGYYMFYHVFVFISENLSHRSYYIIGFFTFIICMSYILFSIEYNQELSLLNRTEQECNLLSAQTDQAMQKLCNVKASAEQTRIYRHDMRHHLSIVMGYLDQDENDKARQYLHSTLSNIDSFTPKYYCQNEMVDILLSMFSSQAESAGIALRIQAAIPPDLTIPQTDLCALLSNALENAIHATENVVDLEKTICFQCNVLQNNLVLQLDNPVAVTPEFINGLPQSHKEGHGFGTQSIVNIVNRYNGFYDFTCDNRIFSLKIVLPLQSGHQ